MFAAFSMAFSGPERAVSDGADDRFAPATAYDSLDSSFLGAWHPLDCEDAPPAAITFNASFGSNMVLQQSPARACVYGMLGAGGTAAAVKISSAKDPSFVAYTVEATVAGGGWKACLDPVTTGGDYTVTATCTGCANKSAATLQNLTFGDVWYCGGQAPSSERIF